MAAIDRRLPGVGDAISRTLLVLGVYGFAFSLLLGRGTYELSLYACAAAVAGLLLTRRGAPVLERPVLAMLGFGFVFLIQGWSIAAGPIAGNFHWALAWSMLAATAVTLLPDRVGRTLGHESVCAVLLVLFVVAQIAAYRLRIKEAGLFSNIHYMALYAVITLPIFFHLSLRTTPLLRGVFVLALAGDFWLLMQTHSRPGYLALLASSLAVVPFLSFRFRWLAGGAILLVPAALYVSGWFGFAARIDDFIANFAQEERPVIWQETLILQTRSSAGEWLFGHGLGQFFRDYQSISSFHPVGDFSSPHNYFLDLLYSHGIVGLVLFLLAYGLFYGKLATTILACNDAYHRRIGILLISVTTAHLVLGFFTIPFFSRHNLHPLSLILGAGLRYVMSNRRDD